MTVFNNEQTKFSICLATHFETNPWKARIIGDIYISLFSTLKLYVGGICRDAQWLRALGTLPEDPSFSSDAG